MASPLISPGGTGVVSVQVYNYLATRGDIGASSALALIMAVVLCGCLFVYFRFFVTWGERA